MHLPRITVVLDDCEPFDIQPTSRDLVKLEDEGVVLSDTSPMRGTYALTYCALSRLARQGKLPDGVEVPKTLEAFMDAADLEPDESDPEGNGSGQAVTPG